MKNSDESPLQTVRVDISALDTKLLSLFAKRRELVREVAKIKTAHGINLRDKDRENELLSHLIRLGKEQNLDSHFILDIFHRIIDDSLQVQEAFLQSENMPIHKDDFKVTHLGKEGSYSYLASAKYFAHNETPINHICCEDFQEVINLVVEGIADAAVLPIENTTSGGINEVYDLLIDCPLSIIGEETLKIEHCLIAKPGVTITEIDTVVAHPQARTQCIRRLKQLGIEHVEYTNSTAHALEIVKSDKRKNIAALAGHEGAALYQLQVIAKDIADQKQNFSRFLILAREPQGVHPSLPTKTTLVLATAQHSGALVDALMIFQQHGVNLTKLESRPILGNPWEEMFYVDLEGNQAEQEVAKAIDELKQSCRYLKVLGSYPSSDRKSSQQNQEKAL